MDVHVQARWDLIRLWTAKQTLYLKAQSRFPKSHPPFKSIERLCVDDPTCVVRLQADNPACLCADIHGDELFRGLLLGAVAFLGHPVVGLQTNTLALLDR